MRRRVRLTVCWIVLALVVLALTVFGVIFLRQQNIIECYGNLRDLNSLVRTEDGFVQDFDVPRLYTNPARSVCPCSGMTYIYRPPQGSESWEALTESPQREMIAWCPSPCHCGCRIVVFLGGGPRTLVPEEDFQEACRNNYMMDKDKVRELSARSHWW